MSDDLQKATQGPEHMRLNKLCSSPAKDVPFMKGTGGEAGFCVFLAVFSCPWWHWWSLAWAGTAGWEHT